MQKQRKLDHIRICLEEDVRAKHISTGFEQYRFVHQALPEISKDEIDTSVGFLGKRLGAPILVSAMTGGTDLSAHINKNLATAAAKLGLAMSVGSQRPAIENESVAYSYQVRDVAPDILLFANLGAVQLNYGYGIAECQRAVEMIQADALILHLNPMQECIQPGGNTDFRDLLSKIARICEAISAPVVVKEVGLGISDDLSIKLQAAGVAAIDVAGAGGTSWVLVEKYRTENETRRRIADTFADWGIPTTRSLAMVRAALPGFPLIASGGIVNGLEVAKAVALGADLAGFAWPTLQPAMEGASSVQQLFSRYVEELRVAMFCVGARSIADIKRARLEKT